MKKVDAYLECRLLGHSWDQIPSTGRPSFGVYVWLRCERCTTLRKDVVNRFNGELLARWYEKPDDYARPKTAFVELRQELLSQAARARRAKSKRKHA